MGWGPRGALAICADAGACSHDHRRTNVHSETKGCRPQKHQESGERGQTKEDDRPSSKEDADRPGQAGRKDGEADETRRPELSEPGPHRPMARAVLVIHGAGEPRRRKGKLYWEPLLASGLGSGYRVRAPRMPRPDEPHYWAWARRIDQLIAKTKSPILVGHSFGASVLLKYLSETVR